MYRVAELERARDDLTARVEEASARKNGAGDRLAALEELIAEATSELRDAEYVTRTSRGGGGRFWGWGGLSG